MFDFLAESPQDRVRLCGPGVSRREFLQVGSLAAVGLSLPQYLQAKEAGIVKPADDRRSCRLMLFSDCPHQGNRSKMISPRHRGCP